MNRAGIQEYSDWFVIQVYGGKENKIKDQIKKMSREELGLLLPRRRLTIRRGGKYLETLKPLYPGYLLYKNEKDYTHELMYDLKKYVNGFVKVLNVDNEPVPIFKSEYEQIESLINEEQIIDSSQAVLIGTKIKIVGGPMIGKEGIIKKVDKRKGRLKVELDFLGCKRLVHLSFSMVDSI